MTETSNLAEALGGAASTLEGAVHVPLSTEVVEGDDLAGSDFLDSDNLERALDVVDDDLGVGVQGVSEALSATINEHVNTVGDTDGVHGSEWKNGHLILFEVVENFTFFDSFLAVKSLTHRFGTTNIELGAETLNRHLDFA